MSTTRTEIPPTKQAQLSENGAAAHNGSKKRKREDGSLNAVQARRFIIRPCPSSPYDKPYTLTPVDLIDRAHLPLSFLDLASGTSGIAPARHFSARIDILEQPPEDNGKIPGPKVLIASLEADGSLYAVERVQNGVYALCKLGSWVTEASIRSASASSNTRSYLKHEAEVRIADSDDWWKEATLSTVSEVTYNARPAKLPRLSMQRPASKSTPVPQYPIAVTHGPIIEHNSATAALAEEPEPETTQKTPEQAFETIAGQYLDALYLSKTSLAFFAKGPLSRARATFLSAQDPGFRLHDLAEFLRSMILPFTALDKKYREKLPEIIRSLPLDGLSDDELNPASQKTKRPKKSKPKKMIPNKHGIYPGEDDYVKKWWLMDLQNSREELSESAEQSLKRRTGELRARETFAQVVLVLEILSLEASQAYQDSKKTEISETQAQDENQAENGKKRKAKKPQDLNLMLDLLLDKLCIWQSVEQDDPGAELSKPSKTSSKQPSGLDSTKGESSDKLKSFCIEVVIPFYMSRLPEKVATINKRLGGPIAVSPAKRTATGSSSKPRKPGEPDSRAAPEKKPRRPLQRVTTDTTSITHHRHPSLARSATDSGTLPHLKREGSEIPLYDIPIKPTQPVSSRDSLAQFQRFAKHQVDLNAMSAATEAKLKKKAAIQEELKDAISTLKKPNRPQAVKEMADLADQRGKRPQLSARKGSSASRGKPQQTVQITATPKKVRKTKDAVMDSPTGHHNTAPSAWENAFVPPSSDPVVPSSAVRPSASAVPGTILKSRGPPNTSMRSRAHAAVEETPTRGSAKMVSFFPGVGGAASPVLPQDTSLGSGASMAPPVFKLPHAPTPSAHGVGGGRDGEVPSTPTKGKARQPAAVRSTPVKSQPPTAVLDTPVRETPVKANVDVDVDVQGESGVVATPAKDDAKGGAERDIYQALGWDDDLDELA